MQARVKEKVATAGSGIVAAGSALMATFATLCCAGPLVVGVLGVGGAVAAARLEPFRPYLLTAAATLLALGFWRAYRRPAACADGSCQPGVGRGVRALLWVAAGLVGASVVVPYLLS